MYDELVKRLESKYCIEGDYTGEDHPVALAMERMNAALVRLSLKDNKIAPGDKPGDVGWLEVMSAEWSSDRSCLIVRVEGESYSPIITVEKSEMDLAKFRVRVRRTEGRNPTKKVVRIKVAYGYSTITLPVNANIVWE